MSELQELYPSEAEQRRAQVSAGANHEKDCPYWIWDWRYSWSDSDCTCEHLEDTE